MASRVELSQPPTLIGVAERLLAAAAVSGAAVYVLINGIYIEFYDDFGVRPEEVGLDRLAVLARAAWVALVVLAAGGPLICIHQVTRAARAVRTTSRQRTRLGAHEADYSAQDDPLRLPDRRETDAAVQGRETGVRVRNF
jgi:hypothetical protein